MEKLHKFRNWLQEKSCEQKKRFSLISKWRHENHHLLSRNKVKQEMFQRRDNKNEEDRVNLIQTKDHKAELIV